MLKTDGVRGRANMTFTFEGGEVFKMRGYGGWGGGYVKKNRAQFYFRKYLHFSMKLN